MPSAAEMSLLALAWAAWAGLHSLLLADFLRPGLQNMLHLNSGQYRLLYSLFSLLTFYPVYAYTRLLGGIHPFFWPRPWLWLQLLLLALALFLLLWSGWDFSRGGFDLFGLRDALRKQDPPPVLITVGAYAHLRHPMHLAALIVVWARSQGPTDLVVSLLLTAYLALGTWHEERRLRRRFGEAYRAYAQGVPLLPFLKVR